MDTLLLLKQINSEYDRSIAAAKEYRDIILTALDRITPIIPKNTSVTTWMNTFTVDTTDLTIFKKLAHVFNTVVHKSIQNDGTGYMRVEAKIEDRPVEFFSATKDLKIYCDFREEIKTTKILVPIGNCEPWTTHD